MDAQTPQPAPESLIAFQQQVKAYFAAHGRDMPWRRTTNPYSIMVSEIMLQQTQAARVEPKYLEFMRHFPDVATLAAAPLSDVISAWLGLGYNRRARYLHQASQQVMTDFDGQFPLTAAELRRLPGVGINTAGAIVAYAYDRPTVFIETNVRTVYLHHFFADQAEVSDKQLWPLVEQTVDRQSPRQWYWALMDYGSHLKATLPSNISQSRHYKKQSKFEGSLRQLRGSILKHLSRTDDLSQLRLDERFELAVDGLLADGLIERSGSQFRLTGDGQVS